MDLSEDQLRDIFYTLDTQGIGYVSIDQLITFAQNAGFADVSALESMETDEDGNISFDCFADGVRALTNSHANGYLSQEHDDYQEESYSSYDEPSHTSTDHEISGDHGHEEENVHTENEASHPHVPATSPKDSSSRPLSPAAHTASTSAGNNSSSSGAVPMDVSILRNQLDKILAAKNQLNDELGDMRMKYSILQKRCSDYEAQLEAADELSREGEEAIGMLEHVTKAKQELEEKEQQQREKLKSLEEQFASVSAERDRLQSLVDATYKGEEDLLKKLETSEKRALKAEAELQEQKEQLNTRLSHHLAQTQEKMDRAIEVQKEEARERDRERDEELEMWKSRVKEEEIEKEKLKAEMENELHSCHNRIQALEDCLSDPKEYERQFLLKGMALANDKPETLAEELQEATKEDLLEEVKTARKRVVDMQNYIDVLLLRVMERIPDILESKAPSAPANKNKENNRPSSTTASAPVSGSGSAATSTSSSPGHGQTTTTTGTPRMAPPAHPPLSSPLPTQHKGLFGGKGKGNKAPTREAPKM